MGQGRGTMATAVAGTLLGMVMTLTSGCGTVRHSATFDRAFVPSAGTTIEVGKFTNATGRSFDIDIEQMWTDALSSELEKERLLGVRGATAEGLTLGGRIVEYDRGNAFKRWLLPGWGATVLSVECDLARSGDGRVVGSIRARRTVSMGGGYTIGAWRTIFGSVARDVVKELRGRLGP